MNELATQEQWTFDIIEKAATYVAKSGLFGARRVEEAVAIMLLAQAEGVHPMRAVQEYHIINGRPALKADAMLARFQRAGGTVDWHENSDTACSATFSHPQGSSVKIRWTMEDAKRAGLIGKAGGNWEKYPRAMLRARVVSEGVRTVFPGVIVGLYTPEEVRDFEPVPAIKADAEPSLEPVEEPKPRNTGEALRELARVHAAHWQPPNEDSAEPAPEPTSEFDPPASLPATQPSAPKEPITKQQIIEISERFRKLGLEHESFRAHKAALMRAITGKDYKSRKELSRSEAEAVMRGLDQLMQIIRLSEVQEFCEALDAEILEGTYSSEHGWNALLEDYRAIKEEEQ